MPPPQRGMADERNCGTTVGGKLGYLLAMSKMSHKVYDLRSVIPNAISSKECDAEAGFEVEQYFINKS